jgi:hypothetical protein
MWYGAHRCPGCRRRITCRWTRAPETIPTPAGHRLLRSFAPPRRNETLHHAAASGSDVMWRARRRRAACGLGAGAVSTTTTLAANRVRSTTNRRRYDPSAPAKHTMLEAGKANEWHRHPVLHAESLERVENGLVEERAIEAGLDDGARPSVSHELGQARDLGRARVCERSRHGRDQLQDHASEAEHTLAVHCGEAALQPQGDRATARTRGARQAATRRVGIGNPGARSRDDFQHRLLGPGSPKPDRSCRASLTRWQNSTTHPVRGASLARSCWGHPARVAPPPQTSRVPS